VRAGDFLFVTGQLGVDPHSGALVSGGAAEQAQQVMRNLETVLRGAGTSLERAVMVRIYLVNFSADYPAVNKVYAGYFKPGRFPARTTVLRSNSRYGPLLLHDAHYAHAGATASEYSWCKPPKIARTRTSTSVTNRWRDSDFRATTDSLGGSGTPGPNEL
jgi:hypothetical protein